MLQRVPRPPGEGRCCYNVNAPNTERTCNKRYSKRISRERMNAPCNEQSGEASDLPIPMLRRPEEMEASQLGKDAPAEVQVQVRAGAPMVQGSGRTEHSQKHPRLSFRV